jgi:hypothetical protein
MDFLREVLTGDKEKYFVDEGFSLSRRGIKAGFWLLIAVIPLTWETEIMRIQV